MQNEKTLTKFIEVELPEPDAFLKIHETLGRIGIASKKSKTLYPTCHILHKKGRYYIVTFFEMFELEGKPNNMTADDTHRRNTIARLLEQWGLCKIVNREILTEFSSMANIKIVPYGEKSEWEFKPKYRMISERNRKGEMKL